MNLHQMWFFSYSPHISLTEVFRNWPIYLSISLNVHMPFEPIGFPIYFMAFLAWICIYINPTLSRICKSLTKALTKAFTTYITVWDFSHLFLYQSCPITPNWVLQKGKHFYFVYMNILSINSILQFFYIFINPNTTIKAV